MRQVKQGIVKMQKTKHDDESPDADTGKARKAPANARPVEGHVLIVDGKFKTQFKSPEDAMAAGMKLKEKYPVIRVEIFNAVERSYAPVELGKGAVNLASE
jgi:hypothetical protein